jgi:hypothetical protein
VQISGTGSLNTDIEMWYIQNVLLFASQRALDSSQKLKNEYLSTKPEMLSVVHPRYWLFAKEGKYQRA